ncbi:MAG: glycosyltransferase, partial [bacterium]|nr:glycosyltransferase [bacterium]
MTIPVTVAIPVKNDAEALRACLATLQGVAEIVVIDSGSTDDTKGVANEHNARLVQFRWLGGFPKKRNWLLQTYAFQTEWVLFLDADEHLTDAFKVALAEAVQQT